MTTLMSKSTSCSALMPASIIAVWSTIMSLSRFVRFNLPLSSYSGKPRLRGADRGTQRRRQAKSIRRAMLEHLVRDRFALSRAAGSPGLAALAGG